MTYEHRFIENPFAEGTEAYDIADRLLSRPGAPPLLPGKPFDAALADRIAGLARDGSVSDCVAAALHLLNDDLDRAHALSQAHEGEQTADYLHQIVHRREGDFGNARYWVAKTGRHPFYEELYTQVTAGEAEGVLAEPLRRWGRWDGAQMVALCQAAAGGGENAADASRLAWREMQGLLAWCVRTRA